MFSTQFIKDLIDIALLLGLAVALWAVGGCFKEKREAPTVIIGLGNQYEPEKVK